MTQIMGDLTKERVMKKFPFSVSGIDLYGPFSIKFKNQRKGVYHKTYVCIFICFATKAIHLECISDLITVSFIETLKRFISRRGKPAKLFTENSKNFVGASLAIKKLYELLCKPDDVLAGYLASEEVEWNFLPPRTPNFGGLWEADVKSFKYYLKRVVGNLKLTFEEFNCIVIQIEGMLNSGPLFPLSSEIDEIEVLTSAHFLIGRPLYALIEPDLTNVNKNRLKSWHKITRVFQFIWKKWSNDYLNNLQERNKWMFCENNVKIGDMVLVKEDNLLPLKWSIVISLFARFIAPELVDANTAPDGLLNVDHGGSSVHGLPSQIRAKQDFEQRTLAKWQRRWALFRSGKHPDNCCARVEPYTPLHYATKCHLKSSYHLRCPGDQHIEAWMKVITNHRLLKNKIIDLLKFIDSQEDLLKWEQPK
ncbi:hypothetical protein AVEN_73247-1 [Araneus ventricosus]|uniref:Integrase catalytic domain-containing protein n=1 Tax=Araneus ventricosus TaxID=182803 RepID=A0A4Y2F4K6_ARAVE|nr:hypothetical protein AVEN_73247-1 [Araneus ventricosus]